jgi:A/G-specific adenine glycosylase
MLMLENPAGDILLRRRPPQGIWGGLWGFPEVESERPLDQFLLEDLNIEAPEANHWPELRHTFSHFHLDITPIHVQLSKHQMSRLSVKLMESGQELWYNIAQPEEVGLAAPIAGLLKTFAKA